MNRQSGDKCSSQLQQRQYIGASNWLLEKWEVRWTPKKNPQILNYFIRLSFLRNEQSFRQYIGVGISPVIRAFLIVICNVLPTVYVPGNRLLILF